METERPDQFVHFSLGQAPNGLDTQYFIDILRIDGPSPDRKPGKRFLSFSGF